MKRFNTVEEYILGNEKWQDHLLMLREILLAAPLEEDVKWGGPVYVYKKKNVVGMAAFKSYVGIWFFQGALLKDEGNKLYNASGDDKKALRQWRFKDLDEIEAEAENILNYTLEAIENVKAGREIKPDRNKPLIIPDDLEAAFTKNPALRQAFNDLTLTQKREYAAYIGKAKREETRINRLEKSIPLILHGVGVMDRYRKG